MTGYTLTWRAGGLLPADGAELRPDTLAGLPQDALAATPIRVGRTAQPLTHLFDIAGQPGETLTLRNLPPLPRLAAEMRSKTLFVHGHVGDDLGAGMAGGAIHVHGNAGHRVGGPSFASARGMSGGEIVVHGSAGNHAGLRMRRGLIYIGGETGASPGYRMIAGTIVLGQSPLDYPGLEMRRGTIVCLGPANPIAPDSHLTEAGSFEADSFVAWRLLMRRLEGLHAAVPPAGEGQLRLFSGDRFELCKGELWQWAP